MANLTKRELQLSLGGTGQQGAYDPNKWLEGLSELELSW